MLISYNRISPSSEELQYIHQQVYTSEYINFSWANFLCTVTAKRDESSIINQIKRTYVCFHIR